MTALMPACIACGIDLAGSAAELNDFLRAHAGLIASVQLARPDLWDALRTRTINRRQQLAN